jgi:hypothetical protein
MWAPSDGLRAHIKQAGLELAPRRATRSSRRPGRRIRRRHRRPPAHPRRRLQHPGRHDLAGNSAAPVYPLPPNQPGVVASYVPGEALFTPTLTNSVLTTRHTVGANITTPGVRWWDPAGCGPLVLGQPQRHRAPRNTLPPPRPPSRATPLPSCARPKADSRTNGELCVTVNRLRSSKRLPMREGAMSWSVTMKNSRPNRSPISSCHCSTRLAGTTMKAATFEPTNRSCWTF